MKLTCPVQSHCQALVANRKAKATTGSQPPPRVMFRWSRRRPGSRGFLQRAISRSASRPSFAESTASSNATTDSSASSSARGSKATVIGSMAVAYLGGQFRIVIPTRPYAGSARASASQYA